MDGELWVVAAVSDSNSNSLVHNIVYSESKEPVIGIFGHSGDNSVDDESCDDSLAAGQVRSGQLWSGTVNGSRITYITFYQSDLFILFVLDGHSSHYQPELLCLLEVADYSDLPIALVFTHIFDRHLGAPLSTVYDVSAQPRFFYRCESCSLQLPVLTEWWIMMAPSLALE